MTLAPSRHLIMVTFSALSSPWSNRCTSNSLTSDYRNKASRR
jgi:hypothetical protein